MAVVRFRRIAQGLAEQHFPAALCELATQAAHDEARHERLCVTLAQELGLEHAPSGAPVLPLAPPHLGPARALLYEVAAQCCVAETESMATLTTLMGTMPAESASLSRQVRETVHAIARDEVQHARIGWGALAFAHAQGPVAWLAPFLVPMMATGAASLFEAAPAGEDDPSVLEFGVLPHRTKRAVFLETVHSVIFPGFERFGISTDAARAWLVARQASPP